jgi:hypothetical protein
VRPSKYQFTQWSAETTLGDPQDAGTAHSRPKEDQAIHGKEAFLPVRVTGFECFAGIDIVG